MTSMEKAEHLELAIQSNCASIIAKFFDSAYWIFSSEVIFAMTKPDLQFVQKKESMPKGLTADACVPEFFKNTEGFVSSICWNEDVQEYFRKLKSGGKNVVISLESLKEEPYYPEEARVSVFTLEIIQKPLSEIERLVRDGEIYVMFRYAWHMALFRKSGLCRLQMVECFFKHGANPNNRGDFGATGLMLACKEQDDRLVSLFLKHGAKVNQQDFSGCTALHYAFVSRDSNSTPAKNSFAQKERIIQILLQHNANLYQKYLFGLSVIDMAKHEGQIILKKPMNRQ